MITQVMTANLKKMSQDPMKWIVMMIFMMTIESIQYSFLVSELLFYELAMQISSYKLVD